MNLLCDTINKLFMSCHKDQWCWCSV